LKSPSAISQRAGNFMAPPPLLASFRTFCMGDETEKVYYKLEEVIGA